MSESSPLWRMLYVPNSRKGEIDCDPIANLFLSLCFSRAENSDFLKMATLGKHECDLIKIQRFSLLSGIHVRIYVLYGTVHIWDIARLFFGMEVWAKIRSGDIKLFASRMQTLGSKCTTMNGKQGKITLKRKGFFSSKNNCRLASRSTIGWNKRI